MSPTNTTARSGTKRHGEASSADSGRQKRAKIHAARSIAAQTGEAGLSNGQLQLDAFVAAHEFEMASLQQSMATSKAVSASRAFQKVPRALRRRTASHNAKRVPRRLRSRARREMAQDKTPVVEARRRKPRTTRARIRAETARRLGLLAARVRKRQRRRLGQSGSGLLAAAAAQGGANDAQGGGGTNDAQGGGGAGDAQGGEGGGEGGGGEGRGGEGRGGRGENGHAGRPKIRPNMLNAPPKACSKFGRRQRNKTWLPTHTWHAKRARMTDPKNPLWRFALALTPTDKVHRATHRTLGEKGTMVWDMSYMSTIGLYGNCTGLQRVLERIGLNDDACWKQRGSKWRLGTRAWTGMLSRDQEGYRRPLCPATVLWNPASAEACKQRQVWLRVPPSAFLESFDELVRLCKMQKPRVYVEDLRFDIGSLELTGPASTETLLAVLTPYSTQSLAKSPHGALFETLHGLTNPAALPTNAVLHFCIHEPRRPWHAWQQPGAHRLAERLASWPAEEGLQAAALFDPEARHAASSLFPDKAMQARRACLQPTHAHAHAHGAIPISLIASSPAGSTLSQGSWTLLAPWRCILPLWHAVVRLPLASGLTPRFGGLDETMQLAFERGLPWFPADYPATHAGAEWELARRRERTRLWEQRPKSKRIHWSSLDLGAGRRGELGHGLSCHFEVLFGLDDDASSLRHLTHVPKPAFDALVADCRLVPPPSPNALLTVRLRLLARGTVSPCARIYRLPSAPSRAEPSSSTDATHSLLPSDLRAQWLARLPCSLALSSPPASHAPPTRHMQPRPWPAAPPLKTPPLVPDAHDLVGFVTTGSFCLATGRSTAIGSIALHKVLAHVRSHYNEGTLCIVRNAGQSHGWLAQWQAL
ncbi:hypothetical protein CDD81_7422 [Ophiocordyceps australis]|uniref:Pop1 N-terminal domain-containing protein n=1 Tax=Ophiocordyceps australis TaxID=1399860 RepID=A0A2C5YCC3_9HYPO|nr:hypothetical protein CDD81_7422 [Ophiocordyceps australis]